MKEESAGSTSDARPPSAPKRPLRLLSAAVLAAAAAVVFGIYEPSSPEEEAPRVSVMGWRPILSQSGHGSTQTESFNIQTGQWRIRWSAAPADETPTDQAESAKQFRLAVHSAVSGRFLSLAVDHQGAGGGVAYVAEEPRIFFLAVESTGLDWTVEADEGVAGEREE